MFNEQTTALSEYEILHQYREINVIFSYEYNDITKSSLQRIITIILTLSFTIKLRKSFTVSCVGCAEQRYSVLDENPYTNAFVEEKCLLLEIYYRI